ncbi:MAG: hypothetical protein EBZ76_04305 [Synechococcaceae bacterium WB9_2_170]|nr:hypothetical protein [Synechococcaceae bacterium WB9_2_170]
MFLELLLDLLSNNLLGREVCLGCFGNLYRLYKTRKDCFSYPVGVVFGHRVVDLPKVGCLSRVGDLLWVGCFFRLSYLSCFGCLQCWFAWRGIRSGVCQGFG